MVRWGGGVRGEANETAGSHRHRHRHRHTQTHSYTAMYADRCGCAHLWKELEIVVVFLVESLESLVVVHLHLLQLLLVPKVHLKPTL